MKPPRLVQLATLAFALVCGMWSVLTPLAEAPDEPSHLGLVLHVADTGRYPSADGLPQVAGIIQLCRDYPTTVRWCSTRAEDRAGIEERERPADEAPDRSDRARWDDPDFDRVVPDDLNQMPQHPPLYYAAMATALRAERLVAGTPTIDRELAFLRFVNILLVTPLPLLTWWLVRRLGGDDELGSIAALLPLAVPQLTHIGATLNNDNLLVLLCAVVLALLAGVLRGDRSLRTAVLVGIAVGLALLTKGFAIVLPPVVVLAYAIGAKEPSRAAGAATRPPWRAPVAAALTLAVALAGWWYAANLLRTGHPMPSIEDTRLSASQHTIADPVVSTYLHSLVTRLVEGTWGAFGWREVQLPALLSWLATAGAIGASAVALVRRPPLQRGGPRLDRLQAAVLLTPFVLLVTFVAVRSAVAYGASGHLVFHQGRYLFGGGTAIALLIALGTRSLVGRRSGIVVLAVCVTMQVAAVVSCLTGWWGAEDVGLFDALRAIVAWSGWPPAVSVLLLAAAPLGLVALTKEVIAAAEASRRDLGTPGAGGVLQLDGFSGSTGTRIDGASVPPSTSNTLPVTHDDASETR